MSALPETTQLELELRDGWLRIWFNRPDVRNAMVSELTDELLVVLDAIRDDRTVRGVTLKGRGGVFCAGGDLKAFNAMENGSLDEARAAAVEASLAGANVFQAVSSLPQFTVSVVEGAAIAGGVGLACATDMTIADKDAKFVLTETRIGLTPAQIAPYIVNRVGMTRATSLMLTGLQVRGDEAHQMGLIHNIGVGEDMLGEMEDDLRTRVLKCAPGAIAATKQVLSRLATQHGDNYQNFAAEIFADCLTGDEGREGVASFVEKRRPSWARTKE